MTAAFGLGMVIIGSMFLKLDGDPNKGVAFVNELGKQLEVRLGWLGPVARWGFVIGAWCAVYSSMLGVWQSVPFLFADCWRLAGLSRETNPPATPDTRSRPYLAFQLALASIPAVSLFASFLQMQKLYSIVGAFFIPILAVVLLMLNGRRDLVGGCRSGWLIQSVLLLAVLGFAAAGVVEAISQLTGN
jgi:hypothetical protein